MFAVGDEGGGGDGLSEILQQRAELLDHCFNTILVVFIPSGSNPISALYTAD